MIPYKGVHVVYVIILHDDYYIVIVIYVFIFMIAYYAIYKREFGIRSLCDKPAFVNDVDIHRRFLGQEVVRNESCNQV